MAEGFVWPRRQQLAVGPADPAAPGINPQEEAPADSKTSAASIYGGRWSSIGYAAASGCRLSLPGYMFFQSMTDLLLRM